MLYCDLCMLLSNAKECPNCGGTKLRSVAANDPVYLLTKDSIWSGMVEDLLNQNSIPFLKQGTLGAGLAAKTGYATETYKFYVPQGVYETAVELIASVFPDASPI